MKHDVTNTRSRWTCTCGRRGWLVETDRVDSCPAELTTATGGIATMQVR